MKQKVNCVFTYQEILFITPPEHLANVKLYQTRHNWSSEKQFQQNKTKSENHESMEEDVAVKNSHSNPKLEER